MKKALIAAFVAVMAFAVQAVNVTWTAHAVVGNANYLPTETWASVALVAGFPNIAEPGKTKHGFTSNADGVLTAPSGATILGAEAKRSVAIGDENVTGKFSVTMDNVTAGDTLTFVYFGPDVTPANDKTKIGMAIFYYNFTVTDNMIKYGLTVDIEELKLAGSWDFGLWMASEVTVAALPEPTVLALLALGIAGLALKRNVA